jgi:WD40 repeat protein
MKDEPRPPAGNEAQLVAVRPRRKWTAVVVLVVLGLVSFGLASLYRWPTTDLRAGSREPKPGGTTSSSAPPTTVTTAATTTTTGGATEVQTVETTGPRPHATTTTRPKPKPTTTTAAAAGPLVPGVYVMGTDGSRPRLLVGQPAVPGQGWSQPRFSPDGTHIAYANQGTLHVVDFHGADQVVGPVVAWLGSSIGWSADSAHLAYTGPAEGGSGASDIWVADTANPTAPRPLRAPGDDGSPTWSPDGRLGSSSELGLFVSDASGGHRTRLAAETVKGAPLAWSPDGSTLFFGGAGGYWFMNADGMNQRRVGSDDPHFTAFQTSSWPVMWSADSRSVVAIGTIGARTGAWVLTAADGTARFVADEVNDARFSPDSARIAGHLPQHGGSTPARIVSWRTDGSDRREVFQAPEDLTVTGLDWSPDGKSMAVNLATWLPLGGAGHGPNGWAIRETDSGSACGTPSGPDGYGATSSATADGVTIRLDTFPCQLRPGERPTIGATVDTPWTIITAAHFDFGDGTTKDVTYPAGCNRDGGSIMVPNPDHTTDYITATVGNINISDNAHEYTQPGRYPVTVSITLNHCSAWDATGQAGPSHGVTATLPVVRLG